MGILPMIPRVHLPGSPCHLPEAIARFPVQDRHLAEGAWHGHPAHDSPRAPPWKPVPPANSRLAASRANPAGLGALTHSRPRVGQRSLEAHRQPLGHDTTILLITWAKNGQQHLFLA